LPSLQGISEVYGKKEIVFLCGNKEKSKAQGTLLDCKTGMQKV
jgi:hypothetical protein